MALITPLTRVVGRAGTSGGSLMPLAVSVYRSLRTTCPSTLMSFCLWIVHSPSTFTSPAPSFSIPVIAHEFHIGKEVGNLILPVFLYTLFQIGQVLANDMTTLLATRLLFFGIATGLFI